MTTDTWLADLLTIEGGFDHAAADRGGATKYGITAQTLGQWRRLGRLATIAEVQGLRAEEAMDIYRSQYVRPFGAIPFDALRAQLCDYGVLSSPQTATRALQRVLGVHEDSVIGPETLTALGRTDWRLVNNALLAERVTSFVQIVEADASQVEWFHGWTRRAVQFLVDTGRR